MWTEEAVLSHQCAGVLHWSQVDKTHNMALCSVHCGVVARTEGYIIWTSSYHVFRTL